jgi:tellurite resistance protein
MQPRLRFLPISVFSIVLGLSGYAIATQRVFGGQGWGEGFPTGLLVAVSALYVALLVLYAAKALRYGDAVAAEFRHPVMISFFPTLSISLLLLAIGYADVSETASLVLWAIGAAANLVFTLVVLSIWIRHTHFEIAHFSPAWFIPVVGNLIVPLVGVQHAPADISWLFFAVGIVFAVALLVIFLYRMVFHQPLHDRHLPTLFILIAPPAVAAVAYVRLTGSYDSFARILYFLAVFFAVFLVVHVRMFARIRFYLSWWAYTFPMAALTMATFLVGKETASAFYKDAATVLWAGLSVLVAGLVVRTVIAAGRHEICVPDAAAPGRASAAEEPAAVEEPLGVETAPVSSEA